jgi:hypothetical protein
MLKYSTIGGRERPGLQSPWAACTEFDVVLNAPAF